MRLLRIAPCLVLAAALVGCDSPTPAAPDAQFAKAAAGLTGPISLTGRTTFAGYYSVSGEVVSDPSWNFLEADAVLTFEGGNNVVLHVTEYFPPPMDDRISEWVGKLTPGGVVKLNAPDDWIATVAEHTGCKVNGTFPVYHGRFDGEWLNAASDFHGIFDGGILWGPFFGVSEEGGPLHVTFAIELQVVD